SLFRARAEADDRPDHDRRRAAGSPERPVRAERREPGMSAPDDIATKQSVPFDAAEASVGSRAAARATPRYLWAFAAAVLAALLPLVATNFVLLQLTLVVASGRAILGRDMLRGFTAAFALGRT